MAPSHARRAFSLPSKPRLPSGPFVDTKQKAVGVFHAGWRGTVKRIVEKGVGEMRRYFGTMPKKSKRQIGRASWLCYDVVAEVRQQFESQFA